MIGSVAPERLSQILKEVAQAEADRYNQALRDALGQGWLIWAIQPASKRLRGYMGSTLAADMILILNKDYLDLYSAGQLPPLQALTEWQQLTAMGEQIQTYQRYFWALLQLLPDFIFRQAQKDFIDLAGKQIAKEESPRLTT